MAQTQGRQRAFGIAAAILLFAVAGPGIAAEYYVSPDGDNWNSGRSPSEAWRTIAKANSSLRAGDIVHLRGGEYIDDPIAPERSGTSAEPIVYTAYQGERPIITSNSPVGLQHALEFIDVAHIIVERVFVSGRKPAPEVTVQKFAYFNNASYVSIQDSEFRYAAGWSGFDLRNGSHHNELVRNRIDFVGTYDLDGDDFGDAIWINNDAHHNLIASNYVTHAAHELLRTRGSYNIIQDNTFDNDWSDVVGPGKGGRNLTVDGTRNVFQRNIVRNSGTSSDSPRNPGMKVEGTSNIIRENVIMNNQQEAIITETGSWQTHSRDNRIYHNTMYNNGVAAWRIRYYPGDDWPRGNVFKNNLVFGNRQDPRNGNEDSDFMILLNDSPADAPGDNVILNNLVAKESAGDGRIYMTPPSASVGLEEAEAAYGEYISGNILEAPVFIASSPLVFADFELAPGSPGLDDAAPLTRAVGTGFGTRVQLSDAGYFADGRGLVRGDVIRVGLERGVEILSIDYDNNEIVVDREIGWSDRDAVSLEFEGGAPDIGAVESGRSAQTSLKPKPPRLMAGPTIN